MLDLFPIVIALLGGGLSVTAFNWLTGRRKENTEYWYGEVIRLRNEVKNMLDYYGQMEKIAADLRDEVVTWRQRYYDEQYRGRLHQEAFRAQVYALRVKGHATLEDIEQLYTKLLLSATQEVEDDTEAITQS